MGNGLSTDQGFFTPHGLRDVGESAEQEQHYWSTKELAEASQTKSDQLGRNSHTCTVRAFV